MPSFPQNQSTANRIEPNGFGLVTCLEPGDYVEGVGGGWLHLHSRCAHVRGEFVAAVCTGDDLIELVFDEPHRLRRIRSQAFPATHEGDA